MSDFKLLITGFSGGEFKAMLYNSSMIILKIICIFIVAFFVTKLGSFIIKKLFDKQKKFKYSLDSKKADTLATLVSSIFRYGGYIIAIVIILTDIFKLTSVLAAAGIGGVAIGLGAQSLIRDVISGFFIVMENQFVVGDKITIDTMTGVVEVLELRVTKIRHVNGDLFIIPNGEIKKLTNHTRGSKAVSVDIPIAFNTDIAKVFEIAQTVCDIVGKDFENIIVEQPKVLGITEFTKDNIIVRITAMTQPNEQYEVERSIRRLITERFHQNNIDFSNNRT